MDQIEHVFRLNEDIFKKPELSEFLSTDHSHDGLEAFLKVLDEFAKANENCELRSNNIFETRIEFGR